MTEGHHVWGISATGSLFPDKKYEIFGRYDYTASVVVPGELLSWDYPTDGSYFIGGIQRNINSNVKMALNYRGNFPYETDKQHTYGIYLNAHFKF
jgi:hypothetical protein